jgi:hypothetical protein
MKTGRRVPSECVTYHLCKSMQAENHLADQPFLG